VPERDSGHTPALDLSRRIVYPVGGGDAVARRRLVYKTAGDSELAMDVYGPAERAPERAPALFFVHGGPIPRQMLAPTEWGVFISYGELAAASGFVGVAFNHRLYAPTDYPTSQADMQAAIDYLRIHADDLGIDADRIGLWAFSGGGPLLAWCLRDRPTCVRCLLAFYAILDVRHLLPPDADAERVARAHAFSPAAHLGAAAATLPIFVARAGRDSTIINTSIDEFVREALAANTSLDFANHASGQHGFDILDDDERSREIIARAMAFAKARLAV
jgi:acetyl esterase/lipase